MKKLLSLLLSVCMVCSFAVPALAAEDTTDIALTGVEATSASVSPYPDAQGHWAESAINRWSLSGIVQGDELGNMNPNKLLTRGEFAAMLVRLLGLKTKAANAFADLKGTEWYTDDILKVAAAGIMLGDGKGNCNGSRPISRQETMVMFARAMGLKPVADPDLSKFSDAADVADWAAGYIAPLADMGIINGVVPGEMVAAPKNNINRASTLALLDKAIKTYITAAGEYTVDAPKGFVVVNVPDAQVSLTGNAAGLVVAAGSVNADVTAKDLDTDALKVDAAADVTLDGKTAVDAVALNDKANLTINKDASVTDLDANAAAQIVNNGEVTNLNTNESGVTYDGNAPEKVNTAPDVEAAKDSDGKVVTEGTGSGDNGGSTVTPSRPVVKADLVVAPLVDQAQANAIPTDQLGTVKVDSRKTTGTTYNVTLTGKDIMNHTNANGTVGHWVGFGMPAAPEGETYTYTVDGTEVESIARRTYTAPNGKTYNTVYFSNGTEDYEPSTIVVTDSADKVVATYNVTFNVTFKSDYSVSMAAELSEELLQAYDKAGMPIRHKTAAGLGLDAAVSGDTMTLTGKTTLAKLEATVAGEPGNDGYVLYALNVGDATIKKIKTGVATYTLADFEVDGLSNGYLMNTKIYDGANKMLLDNTVEIELLDANDRIQGKISQTFKATDCSIEGMTKITATFVDGDETTTQSGMTSEDKITLTLPAPTGTEGYFTGWKMGDAAELKAAGAQVEITADTTFTAQYEEVKPQAMKLRANGPEGNNDPAVDSFPYADTYAAAGITLESNNTITVDATQLVAYKAAQDNQLNHLFGGDGETLFVGLEYTAPATATQYAWAATLEGLRSETLAPLSANTQSTYGNALITYIAFAKYADNAFTFLDDVENNEGNKLESTPYILWADADGNVVGVTCATLSLKTVNKPAAPTYTVTFKNGDAVVKTATVNEGETVAAPEELLVAEGKGFLGWYVGENKYTAAPVQADTTVTAKWTDTIPTTPGVSAAANAVVSALGITSEVNDGVITITIPADVKAKFDALTEAQKGQLNHEDRLFVRVNSNVPAGANGDWFFQGSTDNGLTWRAKLAVTKADLNSKGIDVTQDAEGNILTIGQWFGFATVNNETGDNFALITPAGDWTVIYRWTNAAGEMSYTTFQVKFVHAQAEAGDENA